MCASSWAENLQYWPLGSFGSRSKRQSAAWAVHSRSQTPQDGTTLGSILIRGPVLGTCRMACTWGLMSRRPYSELVHRMPVTWGPMVDSLALVRPRMRSLRPVPWTPLLAHPFTLTTLDQVQEPSQSVVIVHVKGKRSVIHMLVDHLIDTSGPRHPDEPYICSSSYDINRMQSLGLKKVQENKL